jgi:DNA ligase-1
MQFHAVTDTWTALRATRSRKKKAALLGELLAEASQEADTVLHCVVTWLTGELPQGKIGIGPSLLRTVRDTEPGLAALTVRQVHDCFDDMAAISGKGSKTRREQALRDLLGSVSDSAQIFLVGLLMGELRQGAVAGVMVQAISDVFRVPLVLTRRAAMLSGDLAQVALAAVQGGEEALAAFVVTPFTPLHPMLAHPADTPADVLSHVAEPSWETKLDGARVQVHKVGQAVRVFTRHLREITGAVPEVVEAVRALQVQRVILDGEAIALLPSGRPRPFQETMRRIGRQGASLRDQIPLHVAFFDILLCDEDELIDLPYVERMARLDAVVPQNHRVPRTVLVEPEAVEALFESVLDDGHEGLMGKDPASLYAAGARGHGWFKLKNVWTLDLVVLAVEWGSGRRTGKLSNLHLGARDAETGEFVMLGKTFKGLTDAMLEWQTERFLALETHRSEGVVHVRPVQVVEVAFNDVQVSPKYPGGMALRFARVKAYREDKTADQADTVAQVRAILDGATASDGAQR